MSARARIAILASVAVGALLWLAPAATAAHVTCGGTITSDVTLEADLVCDFGSVITVAADRVTVDLGGHAIRGATLVVDGHDRVTIRNGEVQQVLLQNADRNRVVDLALAVGEGKVQLTDSNRNRIARITVGSAFGPAVHLIRSDRNVIRASDITGFESGALFLDEASDRNEISANTAGASQAPAIAVEGSRNRILGNTASGSGSTGETFPAEGIAISAGQRNLVKGNDVLSSTDGILVALAAGRTVLSGNTANGSGDDGIDVESRSTTLLDNSADGNGDLGIEAVPGVRDAGGNSAQGNGNPLECLNVACG
jgi:parallel beta-helix repeat protein